MAKRLCVFDFDNTLFRSPENTDENKRFYEKETGIPWHITKEMSVRLSKQHHRPINPRTGWWGKADTLMPPLVPDPVPQSMWIMETINDLLLAKDCPDTCTIIMTGRHAGLQHQILRILHDGRFCKVDKVPKKDGGLHYTWADPTVSLYLLGMDGLCSDVAGPKPNETFPWKIWIINQYRLVHTDLEEIEFWDDRDEHVEKFTALNDEFQEQVTVHHVK